MPIVIRKAGTTTVVGGPGITRLRELSVPKATARIAVEPAVEPAAKAISEPAQHSALEHATPIAPPAPAFQPAPEPAAVIIPEPVVAAPVSVTVAPQVAVEPEPPTLVEPVIVAPPPVVVPSSAALELAASSELVRLKGLIKDRMNLIGELARILAADAREIGNLNRQQGELMESIRKAQLRLGAVQGREDEAKKELREVEARVAQLQALEQEIMANAPFFLRVVNHERVVLPIVGNVLVGRYPDQVPVDSDYVFRLREAAELTERLGKLRRDDGFAQLFDHPLAMPALSSCTQVLWFGQSPGFSRLHALLELRASSIRSDLVLHRLSTSGLSVNKTEIPMESPPLSGGILLRDGDEIAFPGGKSFKVYRAPTYIKAVVIACDNTNKRQEYFTGGADRLTNAIAAASSSTHITEVLGQHATPTRIFAELEALKNEDKDALLVVIVYMHGSPDKMHAWGGEVAKARLTRALEAIPCRKILIANTCHAGGYWDRHDINGTLILLSSEGDELTRSTRFLDDVARFIQRNLGRGMPIDLKDLKLAYEGQHPPAPEGRSVMF